MRHSRLEKHMTHTYRYQLTADIPPTELAKVKDALAGEPLALADLVGAQELQRQLDALRVSVDVVRSQRWTAFPKDIEILSTYLSTTVVATEIESGPERVRAWRHIGRGGEVVMIALDAERTPDGSLDVRGENQEALAMQLPDLPRWAQSMLAPRARARASTIERART